ncbi:hypothetical protein ABIA30_004512 [Mycobacterium sp. MAA66]
MTWPGSHTIELSAHAVGAAPTTAAAHTKAATHIGELNIDGTMSSRRSRLVERQITAGPSAARRLLTSWLEKRADPPEHSASDTVIELL